MTTTKWQYLEQRPHPWRKQLYLKGRKLKAFTLWINMNINHLTLEEAAQNWNLPTAAIEEVAEYCQTHTELLKQEAEEERRRLEAQGVSLEPKVTHG